MAKKTKGNLEFLFVKAELKGLPEKGLLRSRNKVFQLWIDHGAAPKGASFSYEIRPGT